jgi:hypothetical protein
VRFRRKLPAPFDRISEANRKYNPATDGRRSSTVKIQDNGVVPGKSTMSYGAAGWCIVLLA